MTDEGVKDEQFHRNDLPEVKKYSNEITSLTERMTRKSNEIMQKILLRGIESYERIIVIVIRIFIVKSIESGTRL